MEKIPLILLVDDYEPVRSLLALVLRSIGYQVLEAESATEGLQIAARQLDQPEPLDLLIADVALPDDISGSELARQIQGLYPDIKLLFVTGINDISDLSPVLRKPISLDPFLAEVRRLLDPGVQ